MSFLLAIITAFYSESTMVQNRSQVLDSCMIKGIQFMQEKDFNSAIRHFDACLEKGYSSASVYFQRGNCYLLLNKPNIALVDYNQALRMDTELTEAYFNRGIAQQALHNYTFAESDMLLYRSRVPNDKKINLSLALLMEDMLNFPQAVYYYTECLAQSPNDISILRQRAMAFAASDSIQAAIRDLDRCLAFQAADSSLWICKGNIYYDAGMYKEAIESYNVVLIHYPGDKAALTNRADAFTSDFRYEDAISDYQMLSSKDKYNPEYYFNIGFCYLQLGKNQDAILSFGKAMDTEYSNLGLLLTLRGVAYHNLNLFQEACADWKHAEEAGYKEAANYRKNCP